MHCCLWFRSIFRVRGPWPKCYGYHLSIYYLLILHLMQRKVQAHSSELNYFINSISGGVLKYIKMDRSLLHGELHL